MEYSCSRPISQQLVLLSPLCLCVQHVQHTCHAVHYVRFVKPVKEPAHKYSSIFLCFEAQEEKCRSGAISRKEACRTARHIQDKADRYLRS